MSDQTQGEAQFGEQVVRRDDDGNEVDEAGQPIGPTGDEPKES